MKLLLSAVLTVALLAAGRAHGAEERWRTLDVTLLDPKGHPATGVTVRLMGLERDALDTERVEREEMEHWVFKTDAQGKFTVHFGCFRAMQYHDEHGGGIVPGWGAFHLYASTPKNGGVVSRRILNLEPGNRDSYYGGNEEWEAAPLRLTRDRTNLTMRLRHGPAFTGHVLDLDGNPRASVTVGLVHDLGHGSHTGYGGAIFPRTTMTNAAGVFRFEDVYPNRFYVSVSGDRCHWVKTRLAGQRWQRGVLDVVKVPSDARTISRDLMISDEPLYRYFGRVIDEDGKPIAGANVTLGSSYHREQRTYGDTHHSETTTADAKGRYSIRMATPWIKWIAVKADGFRDGSRWQPEERPVYFEPGRYDFRLRAKKNGE